MDHNEDNESKDILNSINIEILDSILDDDNEKFFQLISQLTNDGLNYNKGFKITNYRLPAILSDEPSYASLCSFFGSEKCLDSLITLLPDGINSNSFNIADKKGRKPIHFACIGGHLNIIRKFYQEESDFNSKDYRGRTPAHYSALSSTTDSIKYLLLKGIDVLTQTDYNEMTPLHLSIMNSNFEIFKFLIENVAKNDFSIFDMSKLTMLHLACESGCVEILDYILSKKEIAKKQMKLTNMFSQKPIDCAIQHGNLECVKKLVKLSKTNLNIHNKKHIPLIIASSEGHFDIVSYLLKQDKVDINVVDYDNKDSLDVAIEKGHIDVVELLIDKGITKKYSEDQIGQTLLKARNNLEMIEILDKKLTIPYNNMGKQFMEQAISFEDKDLIEYFLNKNCTFENINIFPRFSSKWTPFMTYLKEKGFDFKYCKDNRFIPLIVRSINRGNIQSIKKLIDEGIELNSEIISDYDCINTACKSCKVDLFNFLLSYNPTIKDVNKCLKTLVDKYNFSKKGNRPSKKWMNDCIKMAEILINQFEFYIDDDIVRNTIYSHSLEFLELFKNKVDCFDDLYLDYQRMASSEHIPIFLFLERNGCTFQKIEYNTFCHHQYYYMKGGRGKYHKKCYKNSPVHLNLTASMRTEYDVKTLQFLIIYAKNEDLIYSYFSGKGHKNVIDILVQFNCFDSIIEVYKKLNKILYPKGESKDQFVSLINESGNNELIKMVESFEEEELNEDEAEYEFCSANRIDHNATLKKLMEKYIYN